MSTHLLKQIRMVALVISSILLYGCGGDCKEYDKEFYNIMEKAVNGDTQAAIEAYDYCWSELKVDDPAFRYRILGMCGATVFFWVDNAIMSGDPKQIKVAFEAWLDTNNFAPRRRYYIMLAQNRVQDICSRAGAPAGCADQDAREWLLGLYK